MGWEDPPKTEKSREIAKKNISGKYRNIPTSETFPQKNQVIWSSIPSTSHIITTSPSSHEEISTKKKVFHVVGNTSHVGVQLFCISKHWNRSPMLRIQLCCGPVGFTEQVDPTHQNKKDGSPSNQKKITGSNDFFAKMIFLKFNFKIPLAMDSLDASEGIFTFELDFSSVKMRFLVVDQRWKVTNSIV